MESILKYIKKILKFIKNLFKDNSNNVTVIINTMKTDSLIEKESDEPKIESSTIKIEKTTKRVWVNNGTEQKLIDKDLLEDYKNQGYTKGKLKK